MPWPSRSPRRPSRSTSLPHSLPSLVAPVFVSPRGSHGVEIGALADSCFRHERIRGRQSRAARAIPRSDRGQPAPENLDGSRPKHECHPLNARLRDQVVADSAQGHVGGVSARVNVPAPIAGMQIVLAPSSFATRSAFRVGRREEVELSWPPDPHTGPTAWMTHCDGSA